LKQCLILGGSSLRQLAEIIFSASIDLQKKGTEGFIFDQFVIETPIML
jgi:hypothetical protein